MTSPEKAIYFLERSMQNLSKTVRKEMFPTEFFEFFLFFSQFVTHFFSPKINVTPHFLPSNKTT